jgi:HEAT repeat protein
MRLAWSRKKSRWNLCASWLALLVPVALSVPVWAADNDDVKQRIKSVRELGKGGSASIPRIEPYLRDPETGVRLEAVKTLVQIGTQRSLDPLEKAASDNEPEIQIRAVEGLVNFYLPGYVKTGVSGTVLRTGSAIKARFSDTNDQIVDGYVQVRPDVILAIGRVAGAGASFEARAVAARAAGILRGQGAVPDLTQALLSKNSRLIYESLIALQKIRDPKAAPAVRFLLRDLDERVRITAIETSGLLRDAGAVNDLRDSLDRSKSMRVKHAALQSLAEIADPSTHALFKVYLDNRDDGLRAVAAEGLARVNDPADGVTIEKAFNSETKGGPRLADAFALVRYGSTDMTEFGALRYLVNQLNSSAEKDAATAYLTEVASDTAVRQALYPALQNPSATKAEKIGLGAVLAASGDRDTRPYLQTLSQDPDSEVAQAGLRALRNLNARL